VCALKLFFLIKSKARAMTLAFFTLWHYNGLLGDSISDAFFFKEKLSYEGTSDGVQLMIAHSTV
jgi:hypothetical protein